MTPVPFSVPLGHVLDLALPVPVAGRSPADPSAIAALDGRVSPDFLTIFAQPRPTALPKSPPETAAEAAPDMAAEMGAPAPAERDQIPAPLASESPDAPLPLPFWAVPSQSPSAPVLHLGPDTSAPPARVDAAKTAPEFAENAENAIHLFAPSLGVARNASASGVPLPWPAPTAQSRSDNPPVAPPVSPVLGAAHLGGTVVEPAAPAPQSPRQASPAMGDKITDPAKPAAMGGDAPNAPALPTGPVLLQPAVAPSAPPPIAPEGWSSQMKQVAMPAQDSPPRATALAGQSPQTIAASGRTAAPTELAASTHAPLDDPPQVPKNPTGQSSMAPQTTAFPSVIPLAGNSLGGTGLPGTPVGHRPIPPLPPPPAFPQTFTERTATPIPAVAQMEAAPLPTHSRPDPSLIAVDPAPRLPTADRANIAAEPITVAKQAPVLSFLQDAAAAPAVAPPSAPMTTASTATAPHTVAVFGLAQPAPPLDHAPRPAAQATPSAPTAWPKADPRLATIAAVPAPPDHPTTQDQPIVALRPKAVAGPALSGATPAILDPVAYVTADPITADLPLADRAFPRGDAVVGKSSLPQSPPTALPDLVLRHILPSIGKEGAVSVTLAPVELGTLRFEVTSRGEGLHLHLMVDAPATLDLLRRQGDQILAELRQAGFAQASLSFAPGGGQSGAGSPGGDAQSGGAGGDASPPPSQRSDPAPIHRPAPQGLGLLDLRL